MSGTEQQDSSESRSRSAVALMALLGAVCALALIAGAVAWHFRAGGTKPSGLLVMLVLPVEGGKLAPRVVSYVERVDGGVRIAEVDPLEKAVVAGADASRLRDAFPFGGGQAVADAYAASHGGQTPAWIAVEPGQWANATRGRTISVSAPRHLEAYTGGKLYSFDSGVNQIGSDALPHVLDAADYLSSRDRMAILSGVAAELRRRLAAGEFSEAGTDLGAEDETAWLEALGYPRR